MIGLKLLVTGYLENTLRYTTPFNYSQISVMTQALIYLNVQSVCELLHNIVFQSRRVARTYVGVFDWLFLTRFVISLI